MIEPKWIATLGQFAARGFDRSARPALARTPKGASASFSPSHPHIGNGVYPDFLENRQILLDRRVPFVVLPTREIYFASIGREGGFALVEGARITNMTSFLDEQGELRTLPQEDYLKINFPTLRQSRDFQCLHYQDTPLGRDYGTPSEWVGAIESQHVTSGDPPESLRRQVAIDVERHPWLAQYLDSGTGQVNPLQWQAFLDEARKSDLPMVVSSNGLANFYQQARDNIRLLAEGRNALAINVYNPTIDGGFMADFLSESLPSLMGWRQTLQVAIECELLLAIAYNRALDETHGRALGTTPTVMVVHSQGTIHGNLAADALPAPLKELVTVINVGGASTHVPGGLREFVSIADRADPVVSVSAARNVKNHQNLIERKPQYRLVETDIIGTLGAERAGNYHSFYLYSQTAEFQKELNFGRRDKALLISRPFVARWASALRPSAARQRNPAPAAADHSG